MATATWDTGLLDDMLDVAGAAFDSGGDIQLQEADDTPVVTNDFATDAFAAADGGEAEANTIADGVSASGGDLDGGHAVLRDASANELIEADVSAPAGTGAVKLSSLVIGSGDTVRYLSLVLFMPTTYTWTPA